MSSSILKSTLIFSAFTVLAQILAVLRDAVLVRVAGVGQLLDTYYMAFKIPDLVSGFYMIFLGSVVFIPLVTKALKEGGEVEVVKKIREIGTFVVIVILGLLAAMYVLLPSLTQLLVPHWNLEQQYQMVQLSRILLLSQIIFPLGTVAGAISMVYGRVGYVAVSGALYNLGILLGAIFLYPIFGIYGVAIGVVLGAAMFFVVQGAPAPTRNILKQFRPEFKFHTVKDFVYANSSRFASVFLWQVFVLLLLYVASWYGEASISIFNIAYGIDVSLISIIGASVSSVMMPIFSKMHLDGDELALSDSVNKSTFYTLYVSIVISFILYIFALEWTSLLFYFSKVPEDKLVAIASIFAIFMLTLPLQNIFEILRKFLYSTGKIFSVSVMVTVFMVFLFPVVFLINKYLSLALPVQALAYGFLISNIVTITLFLIIYRKQLPFKYLELFHNLFPLLLSITFTSIIWYSFSTYFSFIQSNIVLLHLIQNLIFVLGVMFMLLLTFKDRLAWGVVRYFQDR